METFWYGLNQEKWLLKMERENMGICSVYNLLFLLLCDVNPAYYAVNQINLHVKRSELYWCILHLCGSVAEWLGRWTCDH